MNHRWTAIIYRPRQVRGKFLSDYRHSVFLYSLYYVLQKVEAMRVPALQLNRLKLTAFKTHYRHYYLQEQNKRWIFCDIPSAPIIRNTKTVAQRKYVHRRVGERQERILQNSFVFYKKLVLFYFASDEIKVINRPKI